MADGVVSFGLHKLWTLLTRELGRFWGVEEQVTELKRQLGLLQSLLKDADAKKHDSERLRNFLEDVKEIVYDAEDLFETVLLDKQSEKESGFMKHMRRYTCITIHETFALKITGITTRISKVIADMQRLGIQQIMDCKPSQSPRERRKEMRQTFSKYCESDLVGLEQSVENLICHLVREDNHQVVSISGMGGIGKTTLARQVFHHEIVRYHFEGLAWVCVSQNFTRKYVWQTILLKLRDKEEKNLILQMSEDALQDELFRLLETKKALIVLDDVWNTTSWDRIKPVFPQKRDWKVLLTSRNEGVGLHADPTCFVFRPRSLTPEQSWTLCQRIAFPRRDETEFTVGEEMEAMGKNMVTHCGGLPLAIEVLGGLLAMKHTVAEWKRVHDNIGSHFDNNSFPVFHASSLSYEDLPSSLKYCFLYLAHFPEDYKITAEKLFDYWIAEGTIILTPDSGYVNGETMRNVAEDYLEELVKRNMVIAERNAMTSRIETCHMHDIMREFCLSKANEENFLRIVNANNSIYTSNAQGPSRSRRLSVHWSSTFKQSQISDPKLRSLLFFLRLEEEGGRRLPASCFKSLQYLRVLDLSWAEFEGGSLPSSIGNLNHLRYLSLYQASLSHLPSSLQNLKLLLYFNLQVCGFVHVPNILKEMKQLRYLSLPYNMDVKTKLELGNLIELETLEFFSTACCNVKDLLCMKRLKELSIRFSETCNLESLSSSGSAALNLEKLELLGTMDNSGIADTGALVLNSINVKALVLTIHTLRLPDEHQFPCHLTHVSLQFCLMGEDPMLTLGKLLHLKCLILEHCSCLALKRMVCLKDMFPQLCDLALLGLRDMEEWTVEEGSMSCLKSLSISACKMLKELPDGLKHMSLLKELVIVGMRREWKEKLVQGGEDYYKVQHIPFVQFSRCCDNT